MVDSNKVSTFVPMAAVALSSTDQTNLSFLKDLSTHVVTILDKESEIDVADRQLTAGNITALNTLYGKVVAKLDTLVTAMTVT